MTLADLNKLVSENGFPPNVELRVNLRYRNVPVSSFVLASDPGTKEPLVLVVPWRESER